MTNKLKEELDFHKMMIEEEENEIERLHKKLSLAKTTGEAEQLIHDIKWHREERAKYKYTLSTLNRIERNRIESQREAKNREFLILKIDKEGYIYIAEKIISKNYPTNKHYAEAFKIIEINEGEQHIRLYKNN